MIYLEDKKRTLLVILTWPLKEGKPMKPRLKVDSLSSKIKQLKMLSRSFKPPK
jgi:hypothetical protein